LLGSFCDAWIGRESVTAHFAHQSGAFPHGVPALAAGVAQSFPTLFYGLATLGFFDKVERGFEGPVVDA